MKYNYCILNDKKSSLIKGLLIQSLPIISKPQMRTNINEIDGRDGDIVTKLGYAAYDRTMSIGLFGDFDIYEVIDYFNSEGEAIFSNEPEMIYKYQIINQIDFEKLLRFRTAEVVFHCQPFKYSSFRERLSFDLENPIQIYNQGNVYSKPKFFVTDENTFFETARHIYLDGNLVITIKQPPNAVEVASAICIDTEKMQATVGDEYGAYMNRYVTCDYLNFKVTQGEHTISTDWFGEITNISRWI